MEYTIEHDSEHPPFFNCFRCFKGSHDCERNRGLHHTLSTLNTPSSFVWLCDTCHRIVDPIEPRKQRFRHGSSSGNSTPNGNQTMDSSSNTSKLVLQNVLSLTHNLQNSNPNSDLREIADSEAFSSAEVCPRFLKWNCPHGRGGGVQGEFWGISGNFFLGNSRKPGGTFPKFPKVPLGPPLMVSVGRSK